MSLYQQMLDQTLANQFFQQGLIKRFEPQEIRETIQVLLANPDHHELAHALGDAGISIYPESEDMLAICGLLAAIREDWEMAIENLLMLGENTAYIGATLTLYPVKGTYNTVDDLPDSLYVYSANRKNKLSGQITIPGTSDGVYARLTTSSDIEKTVSYIMDVITFIDNELKSDVQTNLSLMIGYGSTKAKQSADHVMLGAPGSGRYSPKLNVYYYHN